MKPSPELLHTLEDLDAWIDPAARRRGDPVSFPHRYPDPRDAEIAGLFASSLAYGKVSLFFPVLDRVLAHVDSRGGPRAYVESMDTAEEIEHLSGVFYRWTRGVDIALLFSALQGVLLRFDTLEALFTVGYEPGQKTVREALIYAVEQLREEALQAALEVGLPGEELRDLPRGLRHVLASPESGSACKRWNMYLRWMLRPSDGGVDLGIWGGIPLSALVLPLDTHTHRLGQFLGLTKRRDGSWKTAVEITEGLARLDPKDPVRFDFSLAHLGISGGCVGRREASICPECPLDPVCTA